MRAATLFLDLQFFQQATVSRSDASIWQAEADHFFFFFFFFFFSFQ